MEERVGKRRRKKGEEKGRNGGNERREGDGRRLGRMGCVELQLLAYYKWQLDPP
jgi:hypothetical protein